MKIKDTSFCNEKIIIFANNIVKLVECDGRVFNVTCVNGYYRIMSMDESYGLQFSMGNDKSMLFYLNGIYYNFGLNIKKNTLNDMKNAMYDNDTFLMHRTKFEWLITVVMYHFSLESRKYKENNINKGA